MFYNLGGKKAELFLKSFDKKNKLSISYAQEKQIFTRTTFSPRKQEIKVKFPVPDLRQVVRFDSLAMEALEVLLVHVSSILYQLHLLPI